MACKCSKLAKDGGYAGFAMHFYGECYGRTQSKIDKALSGGHNEDKCVGDQTYTICDMHKHDHCTGKEFAEAIYAFKSETREESKYRETIILRRSLNHYTEKVLLEFKIIQRLQ